MDSCAGITRTWIAWVIFMFWCTASIADNDKNISPTIESLELSKIVGTYIGSVFSGDDMDEVITIFYINDEGNISGSYIIDEEDVPLSGTLTNIQEEERGVLRMTWKDRYGTGLLRILFATDYKVFSGFWSDSLSEATIPWDGVKEDMPVEWRMAAVGAQIHPIGDQGE